MGLIGKRKKQKERALQESAVVKDAGRGGKAGSSAERWIFRGLLVSFACAVGFTCFYGYFRASAERNMSSPIESEDNIAWLYQSCYLLYRDLYNSRQERQAD